MRTQKKVEMSEGHFSLKEFSERFKKYTREDINTLADLLFNEILDSYTNSGQSPSRLKLGMSAKIVYPDMVSCQIGEAVELMEKKYNSELQEMGFPFAKS